MNRSVTLAVPRHDPVGKTDVSALQRWMVAICAIRFDLQQGQVSCLERESTLPVSPLKELKSVGSSKVSCSASDFDLSIYMFAVG